MNELLDYIQCNLEPTFDLVDDMLEDERIDQRVHDSIITCLVDYESKDIEIENLLWKYAEKYELC